MLEEYINTQSSDITTYSTSYANSSLDIKLNEIKTNDNLNIIIENIYKLNLLKKLEDSYYTEYSTQVTVLNNKISYNLIKNETKISTAECLLSNEDVQNMFIYENQKITFFNKTKNNSFIPLSLRPIIQDSRYGISGVNSSNLNYNDIPGKYLSDYIKQLDHYYTDLTAMYETLKSKDANANYSMTFFTAPAIKYNTPSEVHDQYNIYKIKLTFKTTITELNNKLFFIDYNNIDKINTILANIV